MGDEGRGQELLLPSKASGKSPLTVHPNVPMWVSGSHSFVLEFSHRRHSKVLHLVSLIALSLL